MAMAELRDWQHEDDRAASLKQRLRTSEEQRVQAEGRCFAAERQRLEAERKLAEVEALLDRARSAGERTRGLVAELIALAGQLRDSIERAPSVAAAATEYPDEDAVAERAQMADALAAAVERLRARVAEVKAGEHDQAGLGEEREAAAAPPRPVAPRATHKHSMSAIARWRRRRKQRKAS